MYRGEFVRRDVEHLIDLGEVQQVSNIGGRIDQRQLPTAAAHGDVCAHQLSESGAIQIIDLFEIQQNPTPAPV